MTEGDTKNSGVKTGLCKVCVSLFIVICLGAQIRANILSPAIKRFETGHQKGTPSTLPYELQLALWRFDQATWLLGLSTHWRMFSPPPRANWYYSVWATLETGEKKWVPLENQGKRSWPQKQLFDFREVKFHLNIYNRPAGLNAFSQHLCEKLWKNEHAVTSIDIYVISRETFSPAKSLKEGTPFGPEQQVHFGNFPCARRSKK